jgi:hypothetical protein
VATLFRFLFFDIQIDVIWQLAILSAGTARIYHLDFLAKFVALKVQSIACFLKFLAKSVALKVQSIARFLKFLAKFVTLKVQSIVHFLNFLKKLITCEFSSNSRSKLCDKF